MAYRGGYQRKATKVDYDGLVSLYVAGKAKAEQTRETVRKERGQQMTTLAEAQAEIDATNILEMDNLFLGVADNDRTMLTIGQKANQQGLISRTEQGQIAAGAQSDINAMGQVSELKRQQYEDIQKGIDNGDLSPATMERAQFDWFVPKDYAPVLKFPDGTERLAKRTIKPVVLQDDDGKTYQYVNVTQEYLDENGELQTTTVSRKWQDIVNTDTRTISQVTSSGKANEFLKILNDNRSSAVINGQVVNTSPYSGYFQTLNDGTMVYGGNIAQETFPDLRNSTEMYINTMSTDDIVSVIYDAGGGTVFSPPKRNFGKRSVDKVNEIYQNQYDKDGNTIKYTSDPLYIEVDAQGNYKPSEDNIAFAQSLVRDRIFKGMKVTREEVKSGRIGGIGGTTDKEAPITDIKYMGEFENGTRERDLSAQHLFSIAKLNYMAMNVSDIAGTPKGTPNSTKFIESRNIFNTKGLLEPSIGTDSQYIDMFAIKDPATGQYTFDGVDSYGKNVPLLNDEVGKNKTLDIDTLAGQEFSTASGVVVIDKDGEYSVHIVGDVEVANMENIYKAGGGTAAGATANKMGLEKQRTVQGISQPLTSSQSRSLWAKLYSKDPNFKAWAISRNYGSNPNAIDVAWRDFTEAYK